MAVLPPPTVPVIDKSGRMTQAWYQYFFQTGQPYTQYTEMTPPPAPDTNKARLFSQDNGAGKTQLVVRFATGAIQIIATEP